jgi:hypothetical protein
VNKLFPLPKEENEPKEEDENVKLVIHDWIYRMEVRYLKIL